MQVVVTGMGIVSSIGHHIGEFKDGLHKGRNGICYEKERFQPVHIGAGIKDFHFDNELSKYTPSMNREMVERVRGSVRRTSIPFKTAVISALEAWSNSGLIEMAPDPQRTGLIVSGNNLTQMQSYMLYEGYKRDPEYLTPSYALSFMDTNYVGVLSEIFRIQGEGVTVGAASASGNAAIIKGCQMIKSGDLDTCLIAAPCSQLSPMELQAFYNIGAMGGKKYEEQPELACRPFDRDHEGFIYGEASAALIIERLESAMERRAPIYGHILGSAFHLDANRLSNASVDGEHTVMKKALMQAKLNPEDIDYINTHGSSTPLGDITELQAIRALFQEHRSEVWLNSTKSLTGHCLYSAGVVEAIASLLQLKYDFIHPTLNLHHPVEDGFRFCAGSSKAADLNTVMSNSFGFGGINTSIIFGKRREL